MKLRKLILPASILSLVVFAACSEDKTAPGSTTSGDLIKPLFNAGIQSRVTGDNWDTDIAVGKALTTEDRIIMKKGII